MAICVCQQILEFIEMRGWWCRGCGALYPSPEAVREAMLELTVPVPRSELRGGTPEDFDAAWEKFRRWTEEEGLFETKPEIAFLGSLMDAMRLSADCLQSTKDFGLPFRQLGMWQLRLRLIDPEIQRTSVSLYADWFNISEDECQDWHYLYSLFGLAMGSHKINSKPNTV